MEDVVEEFPPWQAVSWWFRWFVRRLLFGMIQGLRS